MAELFEFLHPLKILLILKGVSDISDGLVSIKHSKQSLIGFIRYHVVSNVKNLYGGVYDHC